MPSTKHLLTLYRLVEYIDVYAEDAPDLFSLSLLQVNIIRLAGSVAHVSPEEHTGGLNRALEAAQLEGKMIKKPFSLYDRIYLCVKIVAVFMDKLSLHEKENLEDLLTRIVNEYQLNDPILFKTKLDAFLKLIKHD